jgi:Tol biopolymer transport system component
MQGGGERKIADGANPWGVSPDGSSVALTKNNDREIWIVEPSGNHPLKLVIADRNSRLRAVQWSPDGQRLAFIRNTILSDKNHAQIEVVSRSGGAPLVLLSGAAIQVVSDLEEGFQDMQWLPDGRLIYVGGEPDIHGVSCNFWSVKVASTGSVAPPERLTNWSGNCVNNMSQSADGKKLIFSRSSQIVNIYVADFDARRKRITSPSKLTVTEDLSYPIAWTSNGKELLIASNREGSWGIYRQQLDKSDGSLIVAGLPEMPFLVTVSPDHQWILYGQEIVQPSDSNVRLMRVPIAGGQAAEVLPIRLGDIQCGLRPETSCVIAEPVGNESVLMFTATDPVKGRGQELARFKDAHARELGWALSPDTSQVALFSQFDSGFWILNLKDGSALWINASPDIHLRALGWAADGNGFFASSATQDSARLVHIDLDGSVNRLWEVKGSNALLRARPSPDGRKLAIQTGVQNANLWMIENF